MASHQAKNTGKKKKKHRKKEKKREFEPNGGMEMGGGMELKSPAGYEAGRSKHQLSNWGTKGREDGRHKQTQKKLDIITKQEHAKRINGGAEQNL